LRAGETGEPITAADRDNLRAGRPCALARAVAAAAIGDDHTINYLVRQSRDHGADRFRFVKRRDNDGNRVLSGNHTQRLQRKPQLAQASAGLLDLSAWRKVR
jgi:hypothetical protein